VTVTRTNNPTIVSKNINRDCELYVVAQTEFVPDLARIVLRSEGGEDCTGGHTLDSTPMSDTELWAWLKSE
jgi:hypothetical protein